MSDDNAKEWRDILEGTFVPQNDRDWELLDFYATQLFKPKSAIEEDGLFIGRQQQIDDLIEILYQPGAHAILYGERGVGKSSLANIINERIIGPAKYTKVLKINCNLMDNFATIWSNVFFDYDWQGKPISELIRESPQPFTIFKIGQSFEKRHLVILDEFDRVQDGLTKTLIADTIKYLSDNPVRLTVMVVGVGNSIIELFGNHPSIRRCCEEIPMPRMSVVELREILEKRFPQLYLTTSDGVIEEIVKFSQGLPAYTHLLGQLSARSAFKRRSQVVDQTDLKQAIRQAHDKANESTRNGYYKAIQSTKPDNRYREVLLACARAKKNELGQFSALSVCEPYSQIRGEKMGIVDFARHLNAFCTDDRGPALLKSGTQKRFLYQFADPLLEPFIIMVGEQNAD